MSPLWLHFALLVGVIKNQFLVCKTDSGRLSKLMTSPIVRIKQWLSPVQISIAYGTRIVKIISSENSTPGGEFQLVKSSLQESRYQESYIVQVENIWEYSRNLKCRNLNIEYGDYFTLIFHLRREKIVKEDWILYAKSSCSQICSSLVYIS